MQQTYWHKQTTTKPLFPDLLWSRPETQALSGKLLIVGGNAHGFAAPAEAHAQAVAAGIGLTRVLLPHHVKRLLPSPLRLEMEFAPSNPSGSFARTALAELLDAATWADGVLLAGDLGRNSETAIVLEQFINKYQGPLTVTQDAADYFIKTPSPLLARPNSALVVSFAQLQKLAIHAQFETAFRYEMDLTQLVTALRLFSLEHSAAIATRQRDNVLVAADGKVSTTKLVIDTKIWRVRTAASVSVWQLQNPSQPFEALTTAIFESNQESGN